jgi:hypothetical protein
MAEPHDSQPASQGLENEIGRVGREIAGVEEQIAHAVAQIETLGGAGAGDIVRYWMNKEEQLRNEKQQLRRKEEQLRREKELLLEGASLFPGMFHKVAHSDRNIWCFVLVIRVAAHLKAAREPEETEGKAVLCPCDALPRYLSWTAAAEE